MTRLRSIVIHEFDADFVLNDPDITKATDQTHDPAQMAAWCEQNLFQHYSSNASDGSLVQVKVEVVA